VKFKVDFTPQALEDISKLDKGIAGRVIKRDPLYFPPNADIA